MLTKVRTLLDEDSAGFWTDDQIYNALTDGQKEVINILLKVYRAKKAIGGSLSEPLRSLISTKAVDPIAAGEGISIPSDYLDVIEIWYDSTGGTESIVYVVDGQSKKTNFLENNHYMQGDKVVAFLGYNKDKDQKEFSFSTISTGNAKGTLVYLAMPTDIASEQNATLPGQTHKTIVQYAYADILRRDEDPRASNEYQQFLQMVSQL